MFSRPCRLEAFPSTSCLKTANQVALTIATTIFIKPTLDKKRRKAWPLHKRRYNWLEGWVGGNSECRELENNNLKCPSIANHFLLTTEKAVHFIVGNSFPPPCKTIEYSWSERLLEPDCSFYLTLSFGATPWRCLAFGICFRILFPWLSMWTFILLLREEVHTAQPAPRSLPMLLTGKPRMQKKKKKGRKKRKWCRWQWTQATKHISSAPIILVRNA